MALVTDTSFLIDVARGEESAMAALDQAAAEGELLVIPTVVVAEVLAGSQDPRSDIEQLRGAGDISDLSLEDAVSAGEIARETLQAGAFPGWSDALIGGVARNRGNIPILTGNPDHFPMNDVQAYRE